MKILVGESQDGGTEMAKRANSKGAFKGDHLQINKAIVSVPKLSIFALRVAEASQFKHLQRRMLKCSFQIFQNNTTKTMNNILPCIDHKYDLTFSSICEDRDMSLREELQSNDGVIELNHQEDYNQSVMHLEQINGTNGQTNIEYAMDQGKVDEDSKRRQVMEMIYVQAADQNECLRVRVKELECLLVEATEQLRKIKEQRQFLDSSLLPCKRRRRNTI